MAAKLHNKLVRGKGAKTKPIPVKIVSEPATDYPKVDTKWRAQSDLRTLQEAAQIKGDRSRLSAAKTEAKTMMRDLTKVMK